MRQSIELLNILLDHFVFIGGDVVAIACTHNPLDPIVYFQLTVQKDDAEDTNCLVDEFRIRAESLTGFFPQHESRKFEFFN